MRIALLFLIPSVLGASDVNTLFARGQAALAAHDARGARAAYAEACSGPGSDTLFAHAVCAHVNGVLDNSESWYGQALAVWDQLAPAYPDFHASTLICLADLLSASHRFVEAEALLDQAQKIAASPSVVASIGSHLGALYGRLDQPERGRKLLGEAVSEMENIEPTPTHELAYAWNALGVIDLAEGHYSEGETAIRKALALEEKTEYQGNLAAALDLKGSLGQAETLLGRVRTAIEAQYGPESPEAARVLENLGSLESRRGKFGTAEDFSERTLAIVRHARGRDSFDAVSAEVNLAAVYLRQHKTAQAAATMPDEARLNRFLQSDSGLLAAGLHHLAVLRAQQRRWKEADALYRETIHLYVGRLGTDHPDVASIRQDYAAMVKAGRYVHPSQT